MAYDEKLAARLRRAIAGRKGFVEKKMFGGLGFLLNGNMCLGVWKGTLIVRIDPEEYILALGEPGVRPFDITGRPMRGWLMVLPEALKGKRLGEWMEEAIDFVKQLPGK